MYLKQVAVDVDNAFKDPTTLIKRIQNLTGLRDLPFITINSHIGYLQNIVNDLEGMDTNANIILDLYALGIYEYVYIAYAKHFDDEKLDNKAIVKALYETYSNTIEFMLKKSNNIKDNEYQLYKILMYGTLYRDTSYLSIPTRVKV